MEDIVFVLDHRDSIEEELHTAEPKVKEFLKGEFKVLVSKKSFEEALLGHVEQFNQIDRKNRIVSILKTFTQKT